MIKDFGYFKKSVKDKGSHFYSKYKTLSSHEICLGFILSCYCFKHHVKNNIK